jgi:hypothetical protein
MTHEHELRVGVLGTGAIAQIVHLPILIDLPGARVEGVCDIDGPRPRPWPAASGSPASSPMSDDLFASDDIDAVVICTPSYLHQRQVVAALEAGKHVLVERPLALDAKGAEAAVKAAEKADRTLVVAYNNRYRPDIRGVKSFVTAGELGESSPIHGTWFNKKVRLRRPTWRHRKATAGGGAFMDLGVQVLDLACGCWTTRRWSGSRAHMHPGEDLEVEDAASVMAVLETGVHHLRPGDLEPPGGEGPSPHPDLRHHRLRHDAPAPGLQGDRARGAERHAPGGARAWRTPTRRRTGRSCGTSWRPPWARPRRRPASRSSSCGSCRPSTSRPRRAGKSGSEARCRPPSRRGRAARPGGRPPGPGLPAPSRLLRAGVRRAGPAPGLHRRAAGRARGPVERHAGRAALTGASTSGSSSTGSAVALWPYSPLACPPTSSS